MVVEVRAYIAECPICHRLFTAYSKKTLLFALVSHLTVVHRLSPKEALEKAKELVEGA